MVWEHTERGALLRAPALPHQCRRHTGEEHMFWQPDAGRLASGSRVVRRWTCGCADIGQRGWIMALIYFVLKKGSYENYSDT